MEDYSLEVQDRENLGTLSSKRYRKMGLIPAVMYAGGATSVPMLVPEKEFVRLAKRSKSSRVIRFKSKNKVLNGRSAIVKEIQRNYINGEVLHVDFRELREGETVRVEIHLDIFGTPEGVKNQGGILTVTCHSIEVKCLPADIPEALKINIDPLNVGDSIAAEDLELPKGVTLVSNPQEVIVSVLAPKKEEEVAVAEVEGEEGAAAEEAKEAPDAEPEKAKPEEKKE